MDKTANRRYFHRTVYLIYICKSKLIKYKDIFRQMKLEILLRKEEKDHKKYSYLKFHLKKGNYMVSTKNALDKNSAKPIGRSLTRRFHLEIRDTFDLFEKNGTLLIGSFGVFAAEESRRGAPGHDFQINRNVTEHRAVRVYALNSKYLRFSPIYIYKTRIIIDDEPPEITYCVVENTGTLTLQAITPTQPMPSQEELDTKFAELVGTGCVSYNYSGSVLLELM
ncbi:hypothetical protein NQ318_001533 [Aromia moschata]|uniref:Uncharacterized protein n=1 Tax=Aromia moschata TaxID=1265417 RepID=A0AAV8Y978_9CUCU|nr:hypothetical protein NQ318_001533 [Aromia moschata]